ncbi:DUF6204 family protein [Geodermatophilus sp. SYSU D01105]
MSAPSRTYRVLVRGVFADLDEAQRADLLARSAGHDLFSARFTDEGTLAYDPALGPFSFRVVVRVDAGPGEEGDARAAGELALMERLDAAGLGYRRVRSSATSVDDVRIRRRSAPGR